MSLDGSNQDNRSQNGQIQLTNNITIPSNMINAGNLPLGLSYINLASLTSQAGGTAIPFQFALNTGPNQQFTLPLASITQLTNDLQISNAYTLAPQIKFEPEISSNEQPNQMSDHTFQKPNLKRENEISVEDVISTKRGRKKVIVRKTASQKRQKLDEVAPEPKTNTPNCENEIMFDHKGRPFTYPCNQCPKKFTQNSRLTAHLRCHSGIRPYTCTQCGFSFTQKSYLIRHAAVHKEDRPFTCGKCLKTYKHYGSLANHRKLHCRETLNDSDMNGSRNNSNNQQQQQQHINEVDDLDETIQQTIESVQLNHQNNYILTYTTTNSSDLHTTPIVYFNQNPLTAATNNSNNNNNNNSQSNTVHNELQLPGSGPVVFPSQELPSMSAVSLLPTNRTAINELKALTTQLARNVDVDVDIPDFQHHIKQEPTYFNVPIHNSTSHNGGDTCN